MFSWFKRKPSREDARDVAPQFALAEIPDALTRDGGGIPYLDWRAVERWVEAKTASQANAQTYWCEVQRQWADELADAFGRPYLWAESDEVILLTARQGDDARDLLNFVGRCFEATRDVIGPPRAGRGKLVVLCFASQGHMYDFLAPLCPEGSFGGVGGFCVNDGPPYIALPDLPDSLETTLLHEMTHACLGDEVPGWLQEGVAQIVEERLTRRVRPPLEERQIRRHRHHWAKRGLQAFWEARSFKDADRGQELSYELAHVLISILAGDHRARLLAFLRAAASDDLGASAARQHLGMSMGELAARFLGPGDWEPATPDSTRADGEQGAMIA